MQFRFGVNTAAVSCVFYRKCLCFLYSCFSSNNVVSVDITRLRNWFCSSLEDRPSEAWQDRDSNDLMRWAEECRAQTESLPTPISGQRRRRHINILDSVSALRGGDTHCKWSDSPAVTLFRATRLLSTLEKFRPSSRSLASNGCWRERQRGTTWDSPQTLQFSLKGSLHWKIRFANVFSNKTEG